MRFGGLRLSCAVLLVIPATLLAGSPPAAATATDGVARWTRQVPGGRVHWSSPAIADVDGDGRNDVVVGGLDGLVYAFDQDGNNLAGWPAAAVVAGSSASAVASSPAVGDVDGDGTNEVVVGAGSLEAVNQHGGIVVFAGNGSRRCSFQTGDKFNQWTGGGPDGFSEAVFNAPAIGDATGDGVNDIVFGAWDHQIRVISGGCSQLAAFDNTDTVWSAPALIDDDGDRRQEIFIGGDATATPGISTHSGGFFRALEYDGSGALAQRWVRLSNEVFFSGAALGDIDGDGRLEAVVGSGDVYNRSDSNNVWALHLDDGSAVAGWPKDMPSATKLSQPALGDLNGDGRLDVVVGSTGGTVAAFSGAGAGGTLWSRAPGGADEMVGSPMIADLNGSGGPEVVVANAGQVHILDGTTGTTIRSISAGTRGLAHKNAAAVGELGSRGWALVTAGFDPADGFKAWVSAYDIPAPRSAPWAMLRKNARRLGYDPTDARPITCGSGYWLAASDGGIFSFGPLAPFHGSTGSIRLNQPIVGMTGQANRSGYWFVARDGGVFNFGASFFGSMGGSRLNRPIVGMAATPTGRGYWLVASDGGIFNFGDAPFLGSTGAINLNQPIVGMAATPTGLGYWLVARDGGIFNYGDAPFLGSAGSIRLNQPIVGMSGSPSGQGYWFVASDGGIFNYGDAPFLGSTGAIRLNRPVVGLRSTSTGRGYWFVADDGGVFNYGDAEFCGSTGAIRLNQPIVGMG